jgi:flagellar biosynthesis chaperone FliJ
MEDLRLRLAEAESLVAEAERSGQQVNAELQQLKEQVATLTRERDRYRNQLSGAIEHSSTAAARQHVLEALQTWLRPVLELVAEHPEDASPLAVAVLGYLPGIASRLIEE